MSKILVSIVCAIGLGGPALSATFPSVQWKCGSGDHVIYTNRADGKRDVSVQLTSCAISDCTLPATGSTADTVTRSETGTLYIYAAEGWHDYG
jgi:hypothetical protein